MDLLPTQDVLGDDGKFRMVAGHLRGRFPEI
jgi:hypothetical protein